MSRGRPLNIGIPAINRGDLLENCVRTIDRPVDRLLIVANKWNDQRDPSVDAALDSICSDPPVGIGHLEIHEIPGNLGVAGSFNHIMDHLGSCVIASSDAHFQPGAIEEGMRFIAKNPDAAICHLLAMVVFAVNDLFRTSVGHFDENLWPYGWDDLDIFLRLKNLGLRRANWAGHNLVMHEEPSQSIYSAAAPLKGWMHKMHEKNRDYGHRKWNVLDSMEVRAILGGDAEWVAPRQLPQSATDWELDRPERCSRMQSLAADTGIFAPLVFCRDRNGSL
jgi:hypothetical protein